MGGKKQVKVRLVFGLKDMVTLRTKGFVKLCVSVTLKSAVR